MNPLSRHGFTDEFLRENMNNIYQYYRNIPKGRNFYLNLKIYKNNKVVIFIAKFFID